MDQEPYDASDVVFSCDAAKKEFNRDLDDKTREIFLYILEMAANGVKVNAEPLGMVGAKALQLKRNGKPAKRCVYMVIDGKAVILHPYVKKRNDVDKKAMALAARRYKAMGLKK